MINHNIIIIIYNNISAARSLFYKSNIFHKIFYLIIKKLVEFNGVAAVGGLKFSMVEKVYRQLGDFSLGQVPVGGSATWGKCHLGNFNLSDFLSTTFILIHFYLMNVTNENYF